jgi:hypothetical protein
MMEKVRGAYAGNGRHRGHGYCRLNWLIVRQSAWWRSTPFSVNGVLMIHDRSGFSEGTIADAEMIAKLGYLVFAEDIFGKGIVPKTVPEMVDTIAIYNNDRPLMRKRTLAGRACCLWRACRARSRFPDRKRTSLPGIAHPAG